MRRPTSASRLVVEAFAITLADIATAWAGRVALWFIEHCWYAEGIGASDDSPL